MVCDASSVASACLGFGQLLGDFALTLRQIGDESASEVFQLAIGVAKLRRQLEATLKSGPGRHEWRHEPEQLQSVEVDEDLDLEDRPDRDFLVPCVVPRLAAGSVLPGILPDTLEVQQLLQQLDTVNGTIRALDEMMAAASMTLGVASDCMGALPPGTLALVAPSSPAKTLAPTPATAPGLPPITASATLPGHLGSQCAALVGSAAFGGHRALLPASAGHVYGVDIVDSGGEEEETGLVARVDGLQQQGGEDEDQEVEIVEVGESGKFHGARGSSSYSPVRPVRLLQSHDMQLVQVIMRAARAAKGSAAELFGKFATGSPVPEHHEGFGLTSKPADACPDRPPAVSAQVVADKSEVHEELGAARAEDATTTQGCIMERQDNSPEERGELQQQVASALVSLAAPTTGAVIDVPDRDGTSPTAQLPPSKRRRASSQDRRSPAAVEERQPLMEGSEQIVTCLADRLEHVAEGQEQSRSSRSTCLVQCQEKEVQCQEQQVKCTDQAEPRDEKEGQENRAATANRASDYEHTGQQLVQATGQQEDRPCLADIDAHAVSHNNNNNFCGALVHAGGGSQSGAIVHAGGSSQCTQRTKRQRHRSSQHRPSQQLHNPSQQFRLRRRLAERSGGWVLDRATRLKRGALQELINNNNVIEPMPVPLPPPAEPEVPYVASQLAMVALEEAPSNPSVLFTGFPRETLSRLRRVVGRLGGKAVRELPESTACASRVRIVIGCCSVKPVEAVDPTQQSGEGHEVGGASSLAPARPFAARRTLKYFDAILAGAWVLSPEWVLASNKAGSWLPEARFELAGDASGSGGPSRGRRYGPQLFEGLRLHFPALQDCHTSRPRLGADEAEEGPQPQDLERLARRGGAEVVAGICWLPAAEADPPHLDSKATRQKRTPQGEAAAKEMEAAATPWWRRPIAVVAGGGIGSSAAKSSGSGGRSRGAVVAKLVAGSGWVVLPSFWMLQCISSGKILPPPSDWLQLTESTDTGSEALAANGGSSSSARPGRRRLQRSANA
ncbi:unnamed protein product [Polarella glacialis]|uniref:BRCT domain-containing protein n=1 Tax=Polarella glacialis TaxID=89957 RepID=A0A813LXJ1_POLGL|nr:unnamed protein product [Polarella glacialis]